MREHYVIFYDIREPRRLVRTGRILADYGQRMQKSFFEADMDAGELRELLARLKAAIDPDEDGIKIFRMCENCIPLRRFAGRRADFDSYASCRIL